MAFYAASQPSHYKLILIQFFVICQAGILSKCCGIIKQDGASLSIIFSNTEKREVFILPKEQVLIEDMTFEFDDHIDSAILTITDTSSGHSIVLDSETISKASMLERVTVESFLKEFSRKISKTFHAIR